MASGMSENGLRRKLGLFPVTNIVIANMIGTGIFTTSGLLMADLHDPLLMIFLWLVGGIIALCGALCYGELGAAIPRAGGEYVFLSKLYHPMVGFLSGWVSFIVGFSAPIAAASIGFSEYFTRAVPQLMTWSNAIGISDPTALKRFLAILVIISFTLIHLRGIEFGAIVQNVLTLGKIILIGGLLLLGFSFGTGNIQHLFQASSFSLDFGGWKTIGLSLVWILFAYSGWNASTYVGSEIRRPTRNVPLSLLIGTGTVMMLYVCLNILYIYAIPPENMEGVISVGGLAVGHMFGKSWEQVFSLLISFALFSSISAFIILGPRIYYAMAKDGLFFKFASKVNHRSHVPTRSIILQCVFSIIMVMSGTFDQILTYMGFSLGIFPILAVLGVFKLRISRQSRFTMPGYPAVPIIYALAGASILLLALFERPLESSIAICTALAGIPAYLLFEKRSRSNRLSSVANDKSKSDDKTAKGE